MMIQERPPHRPKQKKNQTSPFSTLKQHECEKTYHGNDRGRELLRISYKDELVATMDEWSKSFNFTRLSGLGKTVQNGDIIKIISIIYLSIYSLSNS